MTTLEDLPHKSILDMTSNEAIEHLRLIRLSRRVPVKKRKTTTKKKAAPKINKNQAAELLKLLGG